MEDIVELYKKYGDFQKAVKLSGMRALDAHIKLMASGVVSIKDRIEYGSNRVRLGAKAEELFQKIMPNAIDANTIIKRNNKGFDFLYGDLKIDVKYSSILSSTKDKSSFYVFHTSKDTDIYVIFCEKEKGLGLEDPYILLIPSIFIADNQTNKHITLNGDIFNNFLVTEDTLQKNIIAYERIKVNA